MIESKLALPRVHPGMLRRARLLELLDRDGGAALTIVDAAVGNCKTTLLRSWCIERPEAVIWMTLDRADDDPVRLWTHLATAVERLGEGLGGRALMCLGVRGAPVETAVDELMNGLVAYDQPITIVLDDLHAVGSERSLRSIAHAIERLPANARVIASTRSDPAISLARLRARGALVEIRARELARAAKQCRHGSTLPRLRRHAHRRRSATTRTRTSPSRSMRSSRPRAYLSGGGVVKCRPWKTPRGGPWACWMFQRCARAPGLTSVHDSGWFQVGDKMFDGGDPAGGSVAAAQSF